MSINWVMLSEDKKQFTPLPGEQQIYTSSPRTSFSLKTLSGYPGTDPFVRECGSGTLYLTNRRVLFLPSSPTPGLDSFAAPILNLHDTHVSVPWFGANVWTALVQPVPGGNISTQCPAVELKLTFKDGGAFDFHSRFERIKERLQHAVDIARESDLTSGGSAASLAGVDLGNVHLDELPAYEASSAGTLVVEEERPRERYTERDAGVQQQRRRQDEEVDIPSEPPRYEDVPR